MRAREEGYPVDLARDSSPGCEVLGAGFGSLDWVLLSAINRYAISTNLLRGGLSRGGDS